MLTYQLKRKPAMKNATPHSPAAPELIRVIIADDSDAHRTAIRRLLEQLPEVELVGIAEDGEEALDLVARTQPDLVLMDLKMPRLDGLVTTIKLRAEFPGVRVIIVSRHDSAESKAVSLAAGAVRFIPKYQMQQQLADAIAEVFPDATRCKNLPTAIPRGRTPQPLQPAAECECHSDSVEGHIDLPSVVDYNDLKKGRSPGQGGRTEL